DVDRHVPRRVAARLRRHVLLEHFPRLERRDEPVSRAPRFRSASTGRAHLPARAAARRGRLGSRHDGGVLDVDAARNSRPSVHVQRAAANSLERGVRRDRFVRDLRVLLSRERPKGVTLVACGVSRAVLADWNEIQTQRAKEATKWAYRADAIAALYSSNDAWFGAS